MAFLLDDILLAPIKLPIAGFNWILRQVQTMANLSVYAERSEASPVAQRG